MKHLLLVAFCGLAPATQALGMTASEATKTITGTWVSGTETWILKEDGGWTQIVGGKTFESRWKSLDAPGTIAKIISEGTKKTYYLHFGVGGYNAFSVYREGEIDLANFMVRYDPSASTASPPPSAPAQGTPDTP